jgi:glycopeptide antibiotics resistance protein
MHRLYPTLLETIVAAVFIFPLYLLAVRKKIHSNQEAFTAALFSLYLCVVFSVAGLPDITYFRFHIHVNLTPFAYMFSDYESTLLNILLFVPMGLFLPRMWERMRKLSYVLLTAVLTSLFIELSQIFTYRATDINDLITNTLGAFSGFLLYKGTCRKTKPIFYSSAAKGLAETIGISLFVMFFIQPFFSNQIWSMI